MGAGSKSQTPTEGHSIAHIVCLLAKSLSQQNSDLNETQSNKPRELNRRSSLRVSIDRTSALRYINRVMRTQYLLLVSMASMIVVTVALRPIKIVNRRFRLCIVGFVTLLSSDNNNQLLSGSQPASREGESLASHDEEICKRESKVMFILGSGSIELAIVALLP